jgi:hypothetical protein
MIRETLDPGSSFACMELTPSNGAWFLGRTPANTQATATQQSGPVAPYWVMIDRAGNTLVGSVSPDGKNWTAVGYVTIPMAQAAYIGLAVSSHNTSALSTTTFDSVTGGGGWSYPSPAVPSTSAVKHCGSVGLDLLAPLGLLLGLRRILRRRPQHKPQ